MYNLEQLAVQAQFAVFFMASPDAREIEFLPLRPRVASEDERQSLAARWQGRDLRVTGVIGIRDGCMQMAFKEPLDHMSIAALSLAFTRYCEAGHPAEQQPMPTPVGDSVAWCERLYALPDTRS